MIFDNMKKVYADRLIKLSELYENKISDFYKLSLITKYPKGKFKGLNYDEFSKVSGHSLYHKGKNEVLRKNNKHFYWFSFYKLNYDIN